MEDPFPVIFSTNHHHMLRLGFSGSNHILCESCNLNISGFYYRCVPEECIYRGLHIQCALDTQGLWLGPDNPNPIPVLTAHPRDSPSHLWHRSYQADQNNDRRFDESQYCLACKGGLAGWIYTCYRCNASLHLECFYLPQTIDHPSDDHLLLIRYTPSPPPARHTLCTACNRRLTGYYYACRICNVQFHHVCASFPDVIDLEHPPHYHPIHLYTVPSTFECYICHFTSGRRQWSYVCNERHCPSGFQAHLRCGSGLPFRMDLV